MPEKVPKSGRGHLLPAWPGRSAAGRTRHHPSGRPDAPARFAGGIVRASGIGRSLPAAILMWTGWKELIGTVSPGSSDIGRRFSRRSPDVLSSPFNRPSIACSGWKTAWFAPPARRKGLAAPVMLPSSARRNDGAATVFTRGSSQPGRRPGMSWNGTRNSWPAWGWPFLRIPGDCGRTGSHPVA